MVQGTAMSYKLHIHDGAGPGVGATVTLLVKLSSSIASLRNCCADWWAGRRVCHALVTTFYNQARTCALAHAAVMAKATESNCKCRVRAPGQPCRSMRQRRANELEVE